MKKHKKGQIEIVDINGEDYCLVIENKSNKMISKIMLERDEILDLRNLITEIFNIKKLL